MKVAIPRVLLATTMLLGCSLIGHAELTSDFYTKKSVLAEGNWVKVGVEKTGVYEISYSQLQQMGFSDPSKVSVYGRGGRILPLNFVNTLGNPDITDDLTPVKVFHDNGKLYFYGLGPEEINFESSSTYSTGGYFHRKSNNIYSKRGYYFLTDSRNIDSMASVSYTVTESSPSLSSGLSFIYHELDSMQNSTRSGQLFWGERIGKPGAPKRTWSVDLPDAVSKSQGVMHCEMYISPEDYGKEATISYGFENTTNFLSQKFVKSDAANYSPQKPTVAQIEIPGSKGNVFVGFENTDDMGDFSNLDFWVVSYERTIPTFKSGASQHLIAFPSLAKNSVGALSLENSYTLEVFDVTQPDAPQRLPIESLSGGKGRVGVKYTSKSPVIVIFDKSETQLQISGYEQAYTQIKNQNLHELKDQGADFVIISVPALKEYADEIARLHREHDGIEVIVVTPEECYNEFSGGVPDAMAYRSFMKMLYLTDRKPKNLLLLGPLYGDFRGIEKEHDPYSSIIGFQSPYVSVSRGAHNINDFYGVMSDKFNIDSYERNPVDIGVAILPLRFENEAKIMVDKITDFLERDDHAYYLNLYTAIGGLGDEHTHDAQIRDIDNHFRNMDFHGTILTPLAIDSYGNKEAHNKFLNKLNEGCNLFSYFGHGAEQFLGKNQLFFNAGDVFKLRNTKLPFALFGGCQITNTDRGFRGLGESIVTSTPYGCIGAIVSARETWSGQNLEFFKLFFNCLYTQAEKVSSPHRIIPPTIGEVYAGVKNYSSYANEMAYQLICDPALVLPAIYRSFKIDDTIAESMTAGEKYSVSGNVTYPDGSLDNEFNGQLVLRLNEPEKVMSVGSVETGEDPKSLAYTYRDEQVTMAIGEVKNGKFKIDFHVPNSVERFKDNEKGMLIYLAAYDKSTKTGAGYSFNRKVNVSASASTESKDNISPVIENFEFNEKDCAIAVSVSDNLALNMSNNPLNKSFYLYVDGKECTEAFFVEPNIEADRPAFHKYIYINNLESGEHAARIKVKDLAGNQTDSEITFTYSPGKALYKIKRSEESSLLSTRVEIEGDVPAYSTLVIISSEGNEIWRKDFSGNFIDWNHVDLNGNKVNAGHYKAYLLESGNAVLKGHADPIDIPVI